MLRFPRFLELLIRAEQLVNHVPIVIQLILGLLDVPIFKSLTHLFCDFNLLRRL